MSLGASIKFSIHNHDRTTAKFGVFEHTQDSRLDGRRGALRPRVCIVVCRAGVQARSLCLQVRVF